MRAPFAFIKTNGVWAPTNASVPVLAWYRADSVVQAFGTVSSWPDQSGSGDANRNQAAVGSPTFNAVDASYGNKPSVSFSGAAHLLSGGAWSTGAMTGPITILVVGHTTVPSGANASFVSDPSGPNMIWDPTGFNVRFYNGTTSSPIGTTDANSPSAVLYSDDPAGGGTAAKIFVNDLTNAQTSAAHAMTTGATQWDIAFGRAGITDLQGTVAELVVFGGILTPTDKANLKTYLNSTRAYGIPVV